MTDKLYLQDAYQREFSATILHANQVPGGWEVVLDRTAFYPEGGGQPSDIGVLGDAAVIAVREEGDTIVHVLDALPAEKRVTGKISWARRFYHMQQHTGQHILSAVFDDKFQGATVGFHLGSDSTQIDLNLTELSPAQAGEAETLANAAIYANLPVKASIVRPDEISLFPLRKPPAKDFAALRLISAGDIDCCPCGGTHVQATGEIGLIKILGWEKKNNAIRVHFVCGERALADYQLKHRLVQEMAGRLSAPADELVNVFDARLAKAEQLAKELAAARLELIQCRAEKLLHTAQSHNEVRLIAHVVEDAQPTDAVQLAKSLTATVPAVALLAAVSPGGTKAHLVFATNTDGRDMNSLLKRALTALNGKGGGNARLAQGGVNNPSGLQELLNSLLEGITV